MGEDRVECILERVRVCPTRLKLVRRVDLSPTLRCWLAARATRGIKHFGMACTVAQPANNSWWYAEDGLVIGSSLVASDEPV